MSLSRIIPSILLVLSLTSCGRGQHSWETGDYLVLDSIYCRDPFIVADKNTKTYYLYRSSTTAEGLGGVEAFRSSDSRALPHFYRTACLSEQRTCESFSGSVRSRFRPDRAEKLPPDVTPFKPMDNSGTLSFGGRDVNVSARFRVK